jgi:hypothetical protein
MKIDGPFYASPGNADAEARLDQIAGQLKGKYGTHADRLAIYAPYAAPDGMWANIISELKQG